MTGGFARGLFVKLALEVGAAQVDLRMDSVTEAMVREAHSNGLKVMGWFPGPMTMQALGCSDEQFFDHVLSLKVDTVCTNQPDLLCLRRQQDN